VIDTLARARTRALRTLDAVSFVGPLLLRLTIGVTFAASGWGKLHSLDSVTAFFTELHVPLPHANALLVSVTEFVGGILVALGLGTRFACVPLAITMVVALLTAKADDIHGVVDLAGTTELAYLAAFVVLGLLGPGKASIDHAIFRARAPSSPPLGHGAAASST
jgi:putative oxidoreductase